MAEYPWWASREEISEFERRAKDYVFKLPEDLSDTQLAELFERHCPREFIAFAALSAILDHANCPGPILKRAYDVLLKLRYEVDGCLCAVALRHELSTKKLGYLADRFLGEDISDHAIGVLAHRARNGKDKHSRRLLRTLRQNLPRPRDQDVAEFIDSALADAERS